MMHFSESSPLRVALLMEHPSPHMVGLLDALAARRDCVVEVVYCQRGAPERTWGSPVGNLRSRVLPGFTMPAGLRWNPGVRRAVRGIRADAWILNCIYNWPTTLACASELHALGIPFAYMAEPFRARSGLLGRLRETPLKFLLRRAAGVIGMGTEAERRYRAMLVPDRPSTSVPYFVDLQPFLELDTPDVSTAAPVRFFTASQLIARKGLDVLIDACRMLPKEGWELTIAGAGPLREQLEQAIRATGLRERIRMMGAAPYADRHEAFSGKHVFVFPSRWDGWGMVAPEALAAGLPVISTTAVMSAVELISDGTNGLLIPPDDAGALAGAMRWFLDNRARIPAMSLAARDSVRALRAEDGASRLVQFMSELAVQNDPAPAPDSLSESTPTWRALRSASDSAVRLRVRSAAKQIAIQAASALGRRPGPRGHRIVFYHLVLREDRARFEQHLQFFRDHFQIATVRNLVAMAASGANAGFQLAVTFDDGFRVLMRDCLELLQKYNVPATFYVPTGFIEAGQAGDSWRRFSMRSFCYDAPLEPMSPGDLQTLVHLGHEVQSHGVSHSTLATLTRGAFRDELRQSRGQIEQWTGKAPDSFAYPCGSFGHSPADRSALEENGYSLALTATRGRVTADAPLQLVPRDHAEGNWGIRDLRYFLFS
jgi:glycosyltransferase involved in cell wall biosynthesis/peptidoglycan/xylan/chitin deacetylase (PgdA/CDA1 family)